MNIAIWHLGNLSQLLPASSIIRAIGQKDGVDIKLTWVAKNKDLASIFKYNRGIYRSICYRQFLKEKKKYDLLINLYPIGDIDLTPFANNITGLGFCEGYEYFEDIFVDNKYCKANIFQLYHILSGLTWKGYGCCIDYFPKTKSNKNKVGVSVANSYLRNHVLDNLRLKESKVWYVPYKKNVFKRMDEINRAKKIITDDFIVLYLSTYLRKYVYFLETFPINHKIELFGNGRIIKAPLGVF